MISKNKNLFLKIYIPFVIITIIALIVLQILGSKNRVGYLTDFKLNVAKTLELNNLENINNELDEEGLKNFILNNENITNYIYQFRIRYYDKVFRNSDIYGVYVDLNDLPDYMENAEMEEGGSPYGNFTSDKKTIEEEKINNINYTLKLKYSVFFLLPLYFLILLTYFIIINIKKIDFKSVIGYIRVNYKKLYGIFTLIFIMLIIILYLLGNLNHRGSLENFELITESPAGYVYKANVVSKGFFSPNLIYEYSDKPLKLESKPDYIKNYGYALEINRMPDWYNTSIGASAWNNDDGTFTVSNSTSYNNYQYIIPLSSGEKYKTIIKAIKLSGVGNEVSYYINVKYNKNSNNSFIQYGIDTINCDIHLPLVYSHDNFLIYSNEITIDYAYAETNYPYLVFLFPNAELNIQSISLQQISDNLYVKNTNETIFTSKTLIKNIDDKINVYFKLKINWNIMRYLYIVIVILLLFIYFYLFIFYNSKMKIENYKNIVLYKDYLYIILIVLVNAALFIFQYWLCFPGNFSHPDNYDIMQQAISGMYRNWHPVIVSLILSAIYKLFGYDTYHLFLINLFSWYLAITLIIISLYIKFKNKLIIILSLISYISNIFFLNINQVKDIQATNLFILVCALLFFTIITNNDNKIIKFLIAVLLLVCMLWRHNFIVTIYPIFLFFSYNILQSKNIQNTKLYICKLFSIMIIFALLLILINRIFPNLFIKNLSFSDIKTNHLFLLQIAACSVPNNDDSLILQEWYNGDKTFSHVKELFFRNSFKANSLGTYWTSNDPFRTGNLKNLKKIWIKYIIKYPKSYIGYILNFSKTIWVKNNTYKLNVDKYFEYNDNINIIKQKIYKVLYNYLPDINISIFVIISILLFFITGLLLIFNVSFRNNILLFSFCVSSSSFVSIIIISLFNPDESEYRYMYTVIPISIISLISFITFIYDRGGFKKFIKELKSKKR
ncbi:hypothetical protein EPJ70_09555 [Brachyspira aalborgi]|uniref:Uncharacterized protein n=1 Tax=Brachyspira aalborgi TaxID=29522 RepID=A0A5C8F3S1_9SPIR|nr:hypothetical protein [Brachyspira aalborgi]TXJ44453.1 hypothetical protein EPJ70_09555 [Brachyspira aalborgi]